MTNHAQSYMDLLAWQRGCDLVEAVYVVTRHFPTEETYGLRSQLRRAAVSVPGNIAEGAERWGRAEFAHHLSIAMGSLAEVRTYLELSLRLRYIADDQYTQLVDLTCEVQRLTGGLRKSLRVRS